MTDGGMMMLVVWMACEGGKKIEMFFPELVITTFMYNTKYALYAMMYILYVL